MTDLKPCPIKACPFCGGMAIRNRQTNDLRPYFVSCTRCLVRTSNKDTQEKAADVWNTRAAPSDAVREALTDWSDIHDLIFLLDANSPSVKKAKIGLQKIRAILKAQLGE